MDLTWDRLKYFIQKKDEEEGETDKHFVLGDLKIYKISLLNMKIDNIEYLSLEHNYLQNLDFIENFPKLLSLDVRGNHINNFDGLTNTYLGHLSISIDKNYFSNFFKLKWIKIGILKVEGSYVENEEYWEFIYNSNSYILKFNEDIIQFNHKKNFEYVQANMWKFNHNKMPTISTDNPPSITASRVRKSKKKLDSLILFFAEYQEVTRGIIERCKTMNININDFMKSITKSSPNDINSQSIKKTIRKQGTLNVVHREVNSKQDFFAISEYMNFEKRKIIHVFKIFNSTQPSKFKINYKWLKIKDIFPMIVTMNIILLYILGVINKDLASNILKTVIKSYFTPDVLSSKIKNIFSLKIVNLIGLFYELHGHLKEILNSEKSDLAESLEMNELILNINSITKKNKENLQIYQESENFNINSRKTFIHAHLIKFLDKELKVFPIIVKILQHLHDYLLKHKLDEHFIENYIHSYRVFLEIHQYFIQYFEDSNNNINGLVYANTTLKEFNKFQIEKINYNFHFEYSSKPNNNLIKKRSASTKIGCDPNPIEMPLIKNNELNSKIYGKINPPQELKLIKSFPRQTRQRILSFNETSLNRIEMDIKLTENCDVRNKKKINTVLYKTTFKSININEEATNLPILNVPQIKTDNFFKCKVKNQFLTPNKKLKSPRDFNTINVNAFSIENMMLEKKQITRNLFITPIQPVLIDIKQSQRNEKRRHSISITNNSMFKFNL